jgi:hypothetical protein
MSARRGHRQKRKHGVTLPRGDSPQSSPLAKIKAEVVRRCNNGTRDGFKLAQRLMQALPELREQ